MNRRALKERPKKNQSRIVTSLKKTYKRFLKIRGHPHEIALGMALGLFVGMTPLMGVHTAIAVFFAAMFKWNKISAAIGVWITNPLTAFTIYPVNYFVGAKLTGVSGSYILSNGLDFSTLYQLILEVPEFVWALIIGGIVLGLPLSVAGYYFSYSVVQKYQEDIKKKLAISKEKLAKKKAMRREKKRLKHDAEARKKNTPQTWED